MFKTFFSQLSVELTEAVQSVGQNIVSLLHSSAVLQVSPGDTGVREATRRDVVTLVRKVCNMYMYIRIVLYVYYMINHS